LIREQAGIGNKKGNCWPLILSRENAWDIHCFPAGDDKGSAEKISLGGRKPLSNASQPILAYLWKPASCRQKSVRKEVGGKIIGGVATLCLKFVKGRRQGCYQRRTGNFWDDLKTAVKKHRGGPVENRCMC